MNIIFLHCFLLGTFALIVSSKQRIKSRQKLRNTELLVPAIDSYYNFTDLTEHYEHLLSNKLSEQLLRNVIDQNKDCLRQFPFPHTYVDNLLPVSVLNALDYETPDSPHVQANNGCVTGSQRCFNAKFQNRKSAFDDEQYFGPATLATFRMLKSPLFTQFLENLTGISNLIPDPEYRGSGVHQTLSGGYLSIHADFNRYDKYELHRRVNVFLFLNPNWQDNYGGHLELWSRDLKSCGSKIAPLLGRLVVFSSTDFSYHGHPHPLTCPSNRSRRSLALYYYTKERPKNECVEENCYSSHSTLFQTTQCVQCEERMCKAYNINRE